MASMRTRIKTLVTAIMVGLNANLAASSGSVFIPPMDFDWTSGTTSDKADQGWCRQALALANTIVDSWDLRALTNGPGGATYNMAEVRFVGIRLVSGTSLTIATGAANGFTGFGADFSMTIEPGTTVWIKCGVDGTYPTGAADKVLDVTAAGACVYDIAVIGTSA